MKNKTATVATLAIVSTAFGATTALADSDTYTVKKEDTLTGIAQKFNTTVSNLMQWNGLKSDRIFVNQTLTVSETSQPTTTVKAASATTISSYSYTVVPGDTLLKIANGHGISLAELVTLNQLKDHIIYPGQVLKINGSGTSVAIKSPPPVPITNTSVYKIQSGDTLSSISKKFNITVRELKALNNLTTDLIYAGTSLRVSGKAITASSESESIERAAPPTTDNAKTDTYVIKSGDTLGNIASKFNVSVATLKSINGLTSNLIFTGQKLKITGTASPSNKESVQASAPVESGAKTSATTLVNEAKKLIGIPYKWGGTTTAGFDCSGFIFHIYNKAGYDISRTSAQGYYDRSYEVDQPQIGDLVFFENTYKKGISHLGIYVGNNQFIHASSSGVTITSLDTSYWSQRFEGFKRFY